MAMGQRQIASHNPQVGVPGDSSVNKGLSMIGARNVNIHEKDTVKSITIIPPTLPVKKYLLYHFDFLVSVL